MMSMRAVPLPAGMLIFHPEPDLSLMGANTGVIMLRVLGVLSTVALVATSHSERAASAPFGLPDDAPAAKASAPAIDVAALLTAAHGAPPLICGLAAQSIGNGN